MEQDFTSSQQKKKFVIVSTLKYGEWEFFYRPIPSK